MRSCTSPSSAYFSAARRATSGELLFIDSFKRRLALSLSPEARELSPMK